VRALKIVDFPTLGRPTIPQFNGIVCCFLVTRLGYEACFGVVGLSFNRIVHWRDLGLKCGFCGGYWFSCGHRVVDASNLVSCL
jgi:hypothetical protein